MSPARPAGEVEEVLDEQQTPGRAARRLLFLRERCVLRNDVSVCPLYGEAGDFVYCSAAGLESAARLGSVAGLASATGLASAVGLVSVADLVLVAALASVAD